MIEAEFLSHQIPCFIKYIYHSLHIIFVVWFYPYVHTNLNYIFYNNIDFMFLDVLLILNNQI